MINKVDSTFDKLLKTVNINNWDYTR